MVNLQGKSALILGGVGGLGKATVKSFIEAGVNRIGVIDILNDEKAKDVLSDLLESHANLRFVYRKCGVEDESTLRVAMTDIYRELSGFDLVVNSVGILNEQDHKSTIMVNLVRIKYFDTSNHFYFSH